VETGEKAGFTYLSKQQQLLFFCDLAPELCYNKAKSSSDSNSNNKLINNKIDSDNNNKELYLIKQKRLFLPKNGLTFKKRKYHF
jgi:hypothetical protein